LRKAPQITEKAWAGEAKSGTGSGLDQQLHPSSDDGLPAQLQAEIDAMEISHETPSQLNDEVRILCLYANREKGSADGDAALKALSAETQRPDARGPDPLALRDLYSKNQLKEQLTWFWFNHFNVHAPKGEIRALVALPDPRPCAG
jgi:hypothetical protein